MQTANRDQIIAFVSADCQGEASCRIIVTCGRVTRDTWRGQCHTSCSIPIMWELGCEGGCDRMGRVYCDKLRSAPLHAKTAAAPHPRTSRGKGPPCPPPGPVPAVHTAVSAALASYWWRRHVSDEPAADWLRGLSEKAAAGWRWLGAGCVLEPRLCTLLPRPSTVADPSSSLCRI